MKLMIRSVTLGSLLLICTSVRAQPLLDAGVAPQIGDTAHFVDAPFLVLNGTGANVIWDATSAVTSGTENVGFGDPAGSLAGSSFPACDVVELYTGFETFVDVQPDGLY